MKAKVIKIGSSLGITIPQNIVKDQGIEPGRYVDFNVKLLDSKQTKLMAEYDQFVAQYGQTLKNLAKR